MSTPKRHEQEKGPPPRCRHDRHGTGPEGVHFASVEAPHITAMPSPSCS